MTKRERIEHRRILRESGKCLDCESPELATTAEGTQSRYCTKCLPRYAHRNRRKQPVILRPVHLECDEDGNPLPFQETKKGKAYALALLQAVKRLSGGKNRVTMAQIKAYMGDAHEPDHCYHVAASLEAVGLLEYRQAGSLQSWVSSEPREATKREWMAFPRAREMSA